MLDVANVFLELVETVELGGGVSGLFVSIFIYFQKIDASVAPILACDSFTLNGDLV